MKKSIGECTHLLLELSSIYEIKSPDTNFDELIKKIYGDVSSLEKYEEEENAQLNKQSIMNNEYYDAESIKRRILHQNEQRVSQFYKIIFEEWNIYRSLFSTPHTRVFVCFFLDTRKRSLV